MQGSVFDVLRALKGDIRTLIQEEVLLLKTELSEKIGPLRREVVVLAAGACAALLGGVAFLISLGLLLAWAFALAGLSALFAAFLGLLVVGGAVAGSGGALLIQGVHRLSSASITPEKSIQTLQRLAGSNGSNGSTHPATSPLRQNAASEPEARLSSDELQALAYATEDNLGKTLGELERRVSPKQIKRRLKHKVTSHPYGAGAGVLGAGLLSTLLIWRKSRAT